jgi:uncharacterized protein YndB with AHSA1/START domain
MLKIIGIIAIVLVAAIGAVLAYATTRPDTFRVQRTASMKAPPEKVYALITDFRGWTAWSPYEKRDPAMKRTFGNPASGKGAIYEWDGNKDVGQGRMEIIDVAPPSKVVIKLDFFRPFEAHNTAEFTMLPRGDTTDVTWAMHGPVPYLAKIMHMIFNIDRMVGDDFATGLGNLKALAEK